MMLTRDQILAAQDVKTQTVDVPEWGGSVLIRCMTGRQRDEFERALSDQAKLGELGANMRARIVAASVVDENGNAVFTETDIAALGEKNWGPLERIAKAATQLNLLTDASIEQAEKNS